MRGEGLNQVKAVPRTPCTSLGNGLVRPTKTLNGMTGSIRTSNSNFHIQLGNAKRRDWKMICNENFSSFFSNIKTYKTGVGNV